MKQSELPLLVPVNMGNLRLVAFDPDGIQGQRSGYVLPSIIQRIAHPLPITEVGQTLFILPLVPYTPKAFSVTINGVTYRPPSITVNFPNLTWNNEFVLWPWMSFEVVY